MQFEKKIGKPTFSMSSLDTGIIESKVFFMVLGLVTG